MLSMWDKDARHRLGDVFCSIINGDRFVAIIATLFNHGYNIIFASLASPIDNIHSHHMD